MYVTWSDLFADNEVLVDIGAWRNRTLVQFVINTSRAFTDSGLTPFTLYAYSVSAVNSAVNYVCCGLLQNHCSLIYS